MNGKNVKGKDKNRKT